MAPLGLNWLTPIENILRVLISVDKNDFLKLREYFDGSLDNEGFLDHIETAFPDLYEHSGKWTRVIKKQILNYIQIEFRQSTMCMGPLEKLFKLLDRDSGLYARILEEYSDCEEITRESQTEFGRQAQKKQSKGDCKKSAAKGKKISKGRNPTALGVEAKLLAIVASPKSWKLLGEMIKG